MQTAVQRIGRGVPRFGSNRGVHRPAPVAGGPLFTLSRKRGEGRPSVEILGRHQYFEIGPSLLI